MQRIGVFVCWCGSNIAATVDVERVSQALSKEPGVVFSTNYPVPFFRKIYGCSSFFQVVCFDLYFGNGW